VGPERRPLSLVSTIEEIFERKSSGSGLESREHAHRDVTVTTWLPLSAKVGTNFANKQRLLVRYSLLTDSDSRVQFLVLMFYFITGSRLYLPYVAGTFRGNSS
jgi:hypothetical protein